MRIMKSFGGIELTPDNQAEADAFDLLLSNVRFETHQQFLNRIVSKGLRNGPDSTTGENLNHEERPLAVAEGDEIIPDVRTRSFGS